MIRTSPYIWARRSAAVVLAGVAVLLLVTSCRRPAPASPVHFAREEVALDVRPGTLEVHAMYHFKSLASEPLAAAIFYPFPLDSLHPYPDSIDIAGHHFQRGDSGVSFRMEFRPGGEDSFAAFYRQPLRANSATYIVTSTRQWHRPIDLAQFRVTVASGLRDVSLTYQPDSAAQGESVTTYFFARRGFYPDRDVAVTWK